MNSLLVLTLIPMETLTDWIKGQASEVALTFKIVASVIATVAFFVISAKSGFALAKMIVLAITIGFLLAITWNMEGFAKRMQQQISAPSIVQVHQPYEVHA